MKVCKRMIERGCEEGVEGAQISFGIKRGHYTTILKKGEKNKSRGYKIYLDSGGSITQGNR